MKSNKDKISMSVVRRLPRYYRFLSDLEQRGTQRISSRELSARMGLTASQIRQDLNCFGGFGQQGLGYVVPQLRAEIGSILGIDRAHSAILIGAGNLGRAIASHMAFEQHGFRLIGIFDSSTALIGQEIRGLKIQSEQTLESFCAANHPETAILCVPMSAAESLSRRLMQSGVRSFWNFSHYDLSVGHPDVIVENVHMNDSLMTLCYRMSAREHGE